MIELPCKVMKYGLCKEWNTILIQLADEPLGIQHQTLFLGIGQGGARKLSLGYDNGVDLIHDARIWRNTRMMYVWGLEKDSRTRKGNGGTEAKAR